MILAGRETPAGREYTVTTAQTLVDGVIKLEADSRFQAGMRAAELGLPA
ncbi:hypothetical protein [Catellatospora sp. NPDC049133]|jgi:hypothetical protein